MDNRNPLTPNKIQRLIHYAEDKSFNMPRRLLNDDDLKRLALNQASMNKSNIINRESSSGILDLERIEGFGESDIGDFSLSKSTAFNSGEITGRSTEAEDVKAMPTGRQSLHLDNIFNKMDAQTSEVNQVMRHSIASNYSFHSKRDLTADEASLVGREAPLPVSNNANANFLESMLINNSDLSVGAYFKNRCPELFGNVLGQTESPDRSYNVMPSITEGLTDSIQSDKNPLHIMDNTLDCVPVRQPRNIMDNYPEKENNLQAQPARSTFVLSKIDRTNEPSTSKIPEKQNVFLSQVPDKPKYVQMVLNSVSPQKNVPVAPAPTRETNLLIKNLQASLRLVSEDTEGSVENSISISRIADYLGKQSNVSVTDIMQLNNKKKQLNTKQPLTELHANIPESKKQNNQELQVTNLIDTRNAETASSSGTINTVISQNKYKQNNAPEVPAVTVTRCSYHDQLLEIDDAKSKKSPRSKSPSSKSDRSKSPSSRSARSKSPSSKSYSTLSTEHENCTSFKSADSPLYTSKGEATTSHVPSPNIVYKELDKSVDWREVMQQKHLIQEGLAKAKEQWVEILASVADGYVGVSCPVIITVTTLSDSWLTAKLQFEDLPNDGRDLTIELPRMPLLLSPRKSEKIILNITSNEELNTALKFTMHLKDASIDKDLEQKGEVEVEIKMPTIQAMSCDGVNKITFPPIQENSSLIKSFVLLSDCPADLLLELSVVEGDSIFVITNVQEIKKGDVNKVLMDRQGSTKDGQQPGKPKGKGCNKQLCRLTSGNAIRVTVKFNAPKFSDIEIEDSIGTFNGQINVNLIGVNSVLRKVDLIGVVGTVNLVMKPSVSKLQLSNEPTNIELCNNGSMSGMWVVKFTTENCPLGSPPTDTFPFKISPSKFEIRAGASKTVSLVYTEPGHGICEATLIFEDLTSGNKATIEICGGSAKPKSFPIKTNYNAMSWVRPGRKELSLKNATDKKFYIKCQIIGDGFAIDLPRESRGSYLVPFGPCECRPLPIVFSPNSNLPHRAMLHLAYDKSTSDFSRKIVLYGCASGDSLRWSGLVTYGDTALVTAVSRMPINLELYNKSTAPAFVCARVNFNLQYMCVSAAAELAGGRHIVRPRSRHTLRLRVDWTRVERRARLAPVASLATLTVLTGAEFTRRRILKVIRDESNGELDTSLLPDHLKVLAEKFAGEDGSMDDQIANFKETMGSLNELIGGLQELTAQIDLPQDSAEENTIIISDDTVVEHHHTLCD